MGKVMAELKAGYAGQIDFAKAERPGEGEARLAIRILSRAPLTGSPVAVPAAGAIGNPNRLFGFRLDGKPRGHLSCTAT